MEAHMANILVFVLIVLGVGFLISNIICYRAYLKSEALRQGALRQDELQTAVPSVQWETTQLEKVQPQDFSHFALRELPDEWDLAPEVRNAPIDSDADTERRP